MLADTCCSDCLLAGLQQGVQEGGVYPCATHSLGYLAGAAGVLLVLEWCSASADRRQGNHRQGGDGGARGCLPRGGGDRPQLLQAHAFQVAGLLVQLVSGQPPWCLGLVQVLVSRQLRAYAHAIAAALPSMDEVLKLGLEALLE
jgi:hypothetical protein